VTDEERAKIKAWVENWKVTGELLDQLKWQELQHMDEETSFHIFNNLATEDVKCWSPPDQECGLIQQQALFSKLHALK